MNLIPHLNKTRQTNKQQNEKTEKQNNSYIVAIVGICSYTGCS